MNERRKRIAVNQPVLGRLITYIIANISFYLTKSSFVCLSIFLHVFKIWNGLGKIDIHFVPLIKVGV
jgi:hypothetical protein